MSITDELRVWGMGAHEAWKIDRTDLDCLHAIADLIDAEHKKAVERARMDGMDTTFGDGWVKLPVDADGVPIHVGDELTNGEDLPAKVRCMVLDESGWMVSTRELRGYGVPPATLRHVQPDSWESIIEDAANFALDTQHTAGRISLEPFVERCRRLAGERP